jgi:hypothetical protein
MSANGVGISDDGCLVEGWKIENRQMLYKCHGLRTL